MTEEQNGKEMMGLTRVQSSLELLCQTAGALEASEIDAAGTDGVERTRHVSPSNLTGCRSAPSPFDAFPFSSSSRSTSNQYSVGTSPSRNSYADFDDEDEEEETASVPSRRTFSVGGNYLENLHRSQPSKPHIEMDHHNIPASVAAVAFKPTPSSWFRPPVPSSVRENHAHYGCLNAGSMDHPVQREDTSSTTEYPASVPSEHALVNENQQLRSEVNAKDQYIYSLLNKIDELEGQLTSLKALPVGKISQILVE
jgi:hypothetical protein